MGRKQTQHTTFCAVLWFLLFCFWLKLEKLPSLVVFCYFWDRFLSSLTFWLHRISAPVFKDVTLNSFWQREKDEPIAVDGYNRAKVLGDKCAAIG